MPRLMRGLRTVRPRKSRPEVPVPHTDASVSKSGAASGGKLSWAERWRSPVTALLIYVLRAMHAGRCGRCGRSLVGATAARRCLGGHTLHQTCVDYAMNNEVCPICGIYVDHSERG